ncbi:MAG: tRNA uridine-5-carboxymethylaminomethyl(34) synthesis GTPase MnmE [Desulfarculaceae bacterium]|nr:tRNA uridine-5-carboxymethylaminomethyl(34) synthesis GTPase MnmE [Desulfarculaceae bacterium]MCF8073625.1 tRNA uridine-5-carboxymethylaminomethyl(34) synthesis GTPase MnmE [Desulfarculaceae bacterium]MCF8103143.1 tRNA uridine-5-carboxymethylaminomethyl(34) synthesis GTPase MnmE [Desulfarculaceae bacterium]MCF8115659.1 tRNA uridine-5-carboxymethylaminomethyl(34) synthesis GTPase MnmE [Desulfarculaceae bacterium]
MHSDGYIQGDTIAAIATASGPGGIGILRVSGPGARAAAARLFRPLDGGVSPGDLPPRRLVLGRALDAAGRELDQVLAVFFAAPHSYTTEDVVEIQSHGGPAVLKELLQAALGAGCRLAGPGEFTLRAYLGGRLELSQAEAVAQLINANSGAEARLALAGLAGGLAQRLAPVRDALTKAAAAVEAAIDFPEEAGEIAGPPVADSLRSVVIGPLEKLVAERAARRVWREGALVVLCGRPNVGKSSLFNALLGQERAIVTSIAGTTRDAIEEAALLGGVVCRLTDTAGLGLEPGELEELGRAAARERLGSADLALVVLDGGAELSDEDRAVLAATSGVARVIAANKSDLDPAWTLNQAGEGALRVSAKTGAGLAELAAAIGAALTQGQAEPAPGEAVASQRQAEALGACAQAAARAMNGMEAENPAMELISVDLAEALANLGLVDGIDAPEAVIEAIFDEFCVGK